MESCLFFFLALCVWWPLRDRILVDSLIGRRRYLSFLFSSPFISFFCFPLLGICFGVSIRNGSIRLIDGNGRSWSKSRAIWCPSLPFPFQSKKESRSPSTEQSMTCRIRIKRKVKERKEKQRRGKQQSTEKSKSHRCKKRAILITILHVILFDLLLNCLFCFISFSPSLTGRRTNRTNGSCAAPTTAPSISFHRQDPVPNGPETCPSTKDAKLIRYDFGACVVSFWRGFFYLFRVGPSPDISSSLILTIQLWSARRTGLNESSTRGAIVDCSAGLLAPANWIRRRPIAFPLFSSPFLSSWFIPSI